MINETTEYEREGETWTEEEKEVISSWKKFWEEIWEEEEEED